MKPGLFLLALFLCDLSVASLGFCAGPDEGQSAPFGHTDTNLAVPVKEPSSLNSWSGPYAGAHLGLWLGAELWINPEIDQGFGLSTTLGVAGYPNGEAYKVGNNFPYARMPRMFARQTVGLGGETEEVSPGLNQLAASRLSNRLVITAGKFGVTDIFDNRDRGPVWIPGFRLHAEF